MLVFVGQCLSEQSWGEACIANVLCSPILAVHFVLDSFLLTITLLTVSIR